MGALRHVPSGGTDLTSSEVSADTLPMPAGGGTGADSIPPGSLRRSDVGRLSAFVESSAAPPAPSHVRSLVRLPLDSSPSITDVSSEVPMTVYGSPPAPKSSRRLRKRRYDLADVVIAVSVGVILFAAGVVACALAFR